MAEHVSYARVVTDKPARYAKQLASHLGRKVPIVEDGAGGWSIVLGEARGAVAVGEGVIELRAQSPDAEGLAQVQHVLGSHLERFGTRAELSVVWQDAG